MTEHDEGDSNQEYLMDNSENVDLSEKSEEFKKLVEYGLNPKVVTKLEEIFKTGKLTYDELDERALDAIKEFPVDGAFTVLKQFLDSSLEHVSNKSAFLCGVMKTYRQKMKVPSNPSTAATKGPDEDKIKAILDRTGYTLDVTTGQRKYGGPPPNWTGSPPGSGCEIFVGKIPKDIFEDELIPLFEKCGPLWDLRLMMDPLTGQNRGYAFITFKNKSGAQNAVKQLDNHEIRKGKFIGVTVSINNHRLFVGNIPKNRGKDELYEEFTKHAPGLTEVIIYSSPDDKKKNRGFCFLEYDSHKAASLAKRRLSTGRIKVWGCDIIVDWADPQEEPDEETMSKVKVLYARNLTADVTEEKLKEMFEGHGKVERVKKIKDYAFIHFDDRDHAVKAMNSLNGKEVGGAPMQVSLAKPPSDKKKKEEILRNRERRMMQMMQQRAMMMGIPPPPPRGRGTRLPLPAARNYGDYDYDYYGYGEYQGGYGGGAEPYYDDYYGGGRYDDYYDYGYGSTPRLREPVGRARAGPERARAGRGIPRGGRGGAAGPPTPRGRAPPPPVPPLGRGTRGTPRGMPPPPGPPIPVHLHGAPMSRGGSSLLPPPPPPKGGKFDPPAPNAPPSRQGGQGESKRRFQGGGGQWGSHPIPQQPLNAAGGYNGYRNRTPGNPAHWYQDSYGQQWG